MISEGICSTIAYRFFSYQSTNKNGSEIFQRGMFIIYDLEKNTKKELNEKVLLLGSEDTNLLPCTLTDRQVISIKLSHEKEVLLLPNFII